MKTACLVLLSLLFVPVVVFGQTPNTVKPAPPATLDPRSPNGVATVPLSVSYQGLLTTSNGSPVQDGNYDLQFDLFTVPVAGLTQWTETHSSVPVAKGTYSVILGSITTLNNFDFNRPLYLEMTATAGPSGPSYPITFPRSALASVPSSLAPWTTNGTGIYYNIGNVGIGKTIPVNKLDVVSSSNNPLNGAYTGTSSSAAGVSGTSSATGGSGVYGESYNGVFGTSQISYGNGVYGYVDGGSSAFGVWGASPQGHGVHGSSTTGYAGYFEGNVSVTGTLSKGAGSFKIDHPLDPANKYLYHSFVESPDMKNIYDGVAALDASGEATVDLPVWFEALNKDFRYQLTCIGGYAPVFVAEKISNNRFKIAGGKPGIEVSWQVTGIRKDAFANAHRIPVEENKSQAERGKYIHPKAFGLPETMSIDYGKAKMADEKK
ncbi:MAG TPA: hypothetical protein VL633_08445 [Bacteroidota bacterium]|jgi:hypothetical protein|nr:hypothetical protein [Bacteroidota bacterium]